MSRVLLLVLGASLGTLLRYQLGSWLNYLGHWAWFWGTLTANTIACLVLGGLVGMGLQPTGSHPQQQTLWLLLATGFCGGLSTFSTLMLELVHPSTLNKSLPQTQGLGFYFDAWLYLAATLMFGLLSIWVGQKLGRLLV